MLDAPPGSMPNRMDSVFAPAVPMEHFQRQLPELESPRANLAAMVPSRPPGLPPRQLRRVLTVKRASGQ